MLTTTEAVYANLLFVDANLLKATVALVTTCTGQDAIKTILKVSVIIFLEMSIYCFFCKKWTDRGVRNGDKIIFY